jgi:glycosyltransferase involved in cell wall biosynthesis
MTDQLGQSQVIPYLQELSKMGFTFHLLSVEKKEKLKKNGAYIKTLLYKTGIDWTTLPFTKNPPLVSKLRDQKKLNDKAALICEKEKIDLVHCRSYVPAAAGLKISKKMEIPFLFDMRGFWVDERVDSGLWNLKNPFFRFLYKTYKKKEQQYFDQSAHIISLTHKGKGELINTYHVPEAKVTVIPCCVDMEHFNYQRITDTDKNAAREKLGISEGKKVLSYLGSLGGWYMNDEMLEFFSVLHQQDSNTVFLFITQDKKAGIIAKAIAKGIPAAAIVVQPAGRNEVPLYLSLSSWNIFFIRDTYSKKASSPTKQGEVMAMGIPIICNDIGDTGFVIHDANGGILVKNFSRAEYEMICRQVLQTTKTNKEEIRSSAGKFYDLKVGAEQYRTVYQKLLN